jgi:signal transduction histidine kinase
MPNQPKKQKGGVNGNPGALTKSIAAVSVSATPLGGKPQDSITASPPRAGGKIGIPKQVRWSQGRQSEQMLKKLACELGERVKELNCLYSISSMVERQGASLDEILQGTVDIIPDAWQYPAVTCSQIALQERIVKTDNFRKTPWIQSQAIVVQGCEIGSLDVCYLRKKPERDEGPFLKEERSLINVIAGRIGEIIERKNAERALQESEAHNKALLNAIPDLMFQVDNHGTLLGFHEGKFADLRPFATELLGKNIYVLSDERKSLPRRVLDQAMVYVRRALDTGKPQDFEQHISINGAGRDFEVRIVGSRENEVLGMVREITLRKRLEREILEISGREQRRIGQDLHDSLCQHLAGVGFLSKVLEKKLSSGVPIEAAAATEIVGLIDQAITLTRGFARGLNPVRLEAGGLLLALSELATNTEKFFGITCRLEYDRSIAIDDDVTATHLYRIVQEALNNAIKHGKADTIVISLQTDGKSGILSVEDSGLGFSNTRIQGKGMGLNIMHYRASMIGAALDIRAAKNGGTLVACSFQTKSGN